MSRSTFSVLFYANKSKVKDGIVPVMGRITINGTQSQFSCKPSIPLSLWDAKGNCAKGRTREALDLNRDLDNIKAQIIKHYQHLSDREAFVTAEMVRNAYQGFGSEYETLLRAFDKDCESLKRRVGKNQVQAIRIVLTGTHADMEQIEQMGRLDEWCQDNLDWLRKTYGTDNVVSAVLHMDEETPHIHATIVPIVQTERKKQKKELTAKKRYRTKAPAPRLCADEVMSRANLIRYQDTYAEQMEAYGLQRGIKGSEAQRRSTYPHMSITAA